MRRGDILDLEVWKTDECLDDDAHPSRVTSFKFKTPGRVKDMNNCVGYYNESNNIYWFVLINRGGKRIRRQMKDTPLKSLINTKLGEALGLHVISVDEQIEQGTIEVSNKVPYPAASQPIPDMPEFLRR